MGTDRRFEWMGADVSRAAVMSDEDLFLILAQGSNFDSTQQASTFHNLDLDPDSLVRSLDMKDVGTKIFRRWIRSIHQFLCKPEPDDVDLRERLISAIIGKEGGVAVISAVLVSAFSISPVVSIVISTLLTRVIVAPAADEICNELEKNI